MIGIPVSVVLVMNDEVDRFAPRVNTAPTHKPIWTALAFRDDGRLLAIAELGERQHGEWAVESARWEPGLDSVTRKNALQGAKHITEWGKGEISQIKVKDKRKHAEKDATRDVLRFTKA